MSNRKSKTKICLVFVVAFASYFFQSCRNDPQGLGDSKLSKELNIYNWDGILAPNTVPEFEKEFGVKVTYDLYASNEEMLAKLQAGATGYDLVFPSDYMIDVMIKQEMLQKLDLSNIPNFKNINARFKETSFDPKNEYSIPFQYSAVGVAVDTSKVKGYKNSWGILFDKKYRGHISMLDDIRYGMVPALKYLGFSINTTDEGELNKAKELMIEQKELIRAYSSDTYRDMLKSGDVWIAEGYTGDVYQVMRDNPNIIYFIPEEGSALAVESMCIPKGAQHKYTAEVFMNYLLKPKVHGEITNHSLYANPNDSAIAFINSKIVNDRAIFITDSIIKKSQYIQDVGEATALYDRLWSSIKSN